MPRKNNRPQHDPYKATVRQKPKKRYGTRQQAEKAAEHAMLMSDLGDPLELSVYRDIDGGWYLTRVKNNSK